MRVATKGLKSFLIQKKSLLAIFGNDFIAKSIYDVVESKGALVGKDVSVVGYTDMGWCSHMTPSFDQCTHFTSKSG